MVSIKHKLSVKILCMVFCGWLVFSSCFFSYQKSVEASEIVAGIVATLGGAPVVTALLVGGVVVAGGIAVHEVITSTPAERQDFVNGIKSGFNQFVEESEKAIIMSGNPLIAESEAKLEASRRASEIVGEFSDKALNVTRTTLSGLKKSTVDYWKAYCDEVSYICDNNVSGDVSDLSRKVYGTKSSLDSYVSALQNNQPSLDSSDLIEFNDMVFVNNGYFFSYNNNNQWTDFYTSITNDRVNIPALSIDINSGNQTFDIVYQLFSYNKLTMQEAGHRYHQAERRRSLSEFSTVANQYVNGTTYNVYINDGSNYTPTLEDLSLGVSSSPDIKSWQQTLLDLKENNSQMKAISTGRRELLKEGDEITSVFVDDAVPVKRSSIRENEGVLTGEIGWDIPYDDTWDRALDNPDYFPQVTDKTGAVDVPDDVIINNPSDTRDGVIEWDEESPITDPTQPEENKPWQDISDSHGGSFYPTALDLTNIFPFCIPFDIIYLVNQYSGVQEKAPVIEFEIEYPEQIKPTLGDSYVVTVDFADFVAVRNVLRIFILLLFIAGLMKITRDIIRG